MLDIHMEFRKGILFIRLYGNLNLSNIYKFKKEVRMLIEDNGIHQVVFNLRNVTSIDKAGIYALYENYKCVKENGGFSMFCPSMDRIVRKLIDISVLKNDLYWIGSELEAFSKVSL